MDAKHVLLPKLTRREFRQRMQRDELKACIIPLAATEQHLEHLAMEHDWRSCLEIATRVALRMEPAVLVAPAVMIGISEHHMSHPGTLSASPGAWLSLVQDAIDSMVRAGFRNVLLLNGHGGNAAPLKGIWNQWLLRFQVNLQWQSYWDVLTTDDARAHLRTGDFPGHAQEFETAIAWALFPENVRQDALADQPDSSPGEATPEAGRALLELIEQRLVRHVGQMISGESRAEIPPYFP